MFERIVGFKDETIDEESQRKKKGGIPFKSNEKDKTPVSLIERSIKKDKEEVTG